MHQASLAQRDIELFTSIVVALGEIRELATLRRETVRLLPTAVPTTLMAWNEVDRASGSMVVEMAPDLTQEASEADFLAHIGEHPVIAAYERTQDGRPLAISDFLDARAFHSTRIYQRFYRLLNAEDQISMVLPEPRLLIGLALNRATRGFSERDRTLLNLLRPAIAQAYRNATAAERADRLLAGVASAAERSGEGVLLLGAHGEIEFLGVRSGELLARWFDGPVSQSLPPLLAQWLGETRARPGPAWPFVAERDGRRLAVHLLGTHAGEVLLLSESTPLAPSIATVSLGLTPREREVMDLVSQAVGTGEIAQRLQISPATVYKHVQNSLDKLGASSRMEAVNLLRQAE